MQKVNNYICPVCRKKYKFLQAWGDHVTKIHPRTIPVDWSYARYYYYLLTNKDHGTCIVCKKDTNWNDATEKYERFCSNPECKDAYRNMFKNRMIDKYGKVTLLDDPEQQRRMIANRKISGTYKFNNGKEVDYCGTYELDFLKMLNTFLHFDGNDIMGPSPHTYYYQYKNENDKENEGKKFYIPDYFIPSINLEVEIKQGTNTHPEILKIDKVKELEKDDHMKSIQGINYIKIVEKDYSDFFKLLTELATEYTKDEIKDSDALEAFTKYDDSYINSSKNNCKLSSFKFIEINKNIIDIFKKDCKALCHVRIAPNCFGELVLDKNKIVGFYNTSKNDEAIWLQAIEIMEEYKGKNLGNQLLDRAIRKCKITNLAVNIDNEVAIQMYLKRGFEIYSRNNKQLYMWINNI